DAVLRIDGGRKTHRHRALAHKSVRPDRDAHRLSRAQSDDSGPEAQRNRLRRRVLAAVLVAGSQSPRPGADLSCVDETSDATESRAQRRRVEPELRRAHDALHAQLLRIEIRGAGW